MSNNNNVVQQSRPRQFYYMNSTQGEVWKSIHEDEIDGLRNMESPRFITWTSTNYEKGSPYTPDYFAQFLPIDIDFKNDIAAATKETKRLVVELGADAQYIKVFCSGGKGFHVLLPAALFGNGGLQGPCLPGAAKRLVFGLGIEADISLYCYGQGHMLREPNLKRDDGKYKVQISLAELEALTPESYAELVQGPRPLLNSPCVHKPSDKLAALYLACLEAETAAKAKVKAKREEAKVKDCTDLEVLRLGLALDFLATESGSDFESYAEWKRILLPLHLAGCEDLALAFSRMVPNFDERAFHRQWQAISDEVGVPLTIGSIFHEANSKGWHEFGVWDELQPQIETRLAEAATNPALLHEAEFIEQLAYLKWAKPAEHAKILSLPLLRGYKAAINRLVKQQEDAALPEKPTQKQIALAVIEAFGEGNLAFVAPEFFRFNGKIWEILPTDHEVKQKAHGILGESNFRAGDVISIVKIVEVETLKTDAKLDQPHREVAAFNNGELHWLNGSWQLQPHNRESWLTAVTPHDYKPEATCPKFCKFLGEVFEGDSDADSKANFIFEMIGASLVFSVRFERGAILLGDNGRNGKSTLLDVLTYVLGAENCSTVPMHDLGGRFNKGRIRGKNANICHEVKLGSGMADDVVKEIVSGNTLFAEDKGQDGYSFRPFCTLWIGANVLPSQRDYSSALTRRFEIVEFNRQFLEGEGQVPGMADMLKGEAEGIITLALQHYGEALKRGRLTELRSSAQAKRRWQTENDDFEVFLEDFVAFQSEADPVEQVQDIWNTPTEKILTAFEGWANKQHSPFKLSGTGLGKRLAKYKNRGVHNKKVMHQNAWVRGWEGIRLR